VCADRGIFLPETWRLPPSICAFTSEAFYEGKLHPKVCLERQLLLGTAPFVGSGLWIVQTPHEGSQNASPEEVDVVERIVAILLADGARWTDSAGTTRRLTPSEILIVAPYNMQVTLLTDRLGPRGPTKGRALGWAKTSVAPWQ